MAQVKVEVNYLKEEVALVNLEDTQRKIVSPAEYETLAQALGIAHITENIRQHVAENSTIIGKLFPSHAFNHHFLSYLHFELNALTKNNIVFEDSHFFTTNKKPSLFRK